jgi:hypothetical protein
MKSSHGKCDFPQTITVFSFGVNSCTIQMRDAHGLLNNLRRPLQALCDGSEVQLLHKSSTAVPRSLPLRWSLWQTRGARSKIEAILAIFRLWTYICQYVTSTAVNASHHSHLLIPLYDVVLVYTHSVYLIDI